MLKLKSFVFFAKQRGFAYLKKDKILMIFLEFLKLIKSKEEYKKAFSMEFEKM